MSAFPAATSLPIGIATDPVFRRRFHGGVMRQCEDNSRSFCGNSARTRARVRHMQPMQKDLEALFRMVKVLIVDDDHHMRKVARSLLLAIGIKNIHEANDGTSGLEAIIAVAPNVVILDWEMPGLTGPEFVRHVRVPGRFPLPNVPIIMLTAHGERSRVIEAV